MLREKGSEKVLEPWGAGVERGAGAGQWLGEFLERGSSLFFF